MSIVVWDGTTLAADMGATTGDHMTIASKMWRITDNIVTAWTGSLDQGMRLATWYHHGADPDTFPEMQQNSEAFTRLIVLDRTGLGIYERTPYRLRYGERQKYMAWGSGMDVALGALAMGADAVQAVRVTCQHSVFCGGGIEFVHTKCGASGLVLYPNVISEL